MSNIEWDQERLYVLEMLKETRSGLAELQKMVQDLKLETTKTFAEIKTKLGMYAIVGSAVISLIVSVLSKVFQNMVG